jgi:predicted RNA binding protein YcfA (HicA-like mRNA interferase family)
VLSGSEICRILEQNGFVAVHQRLHDPVCRGTLLSIVRQSELPRSLFETEK